MSKIGPILGIIGGILLLLAGLIEMNGLGKIYEMEETLVALGDSFSNYGVDLNQLNIFVMVTLILGLCAIGVSIVGLFIKYGNALVIVMGVIILICTFIEQAPAKTLTISATTINLPAIPLSDNFYFIDIFLILLGGVLGLLFFKKKEKILNKYGEDISGTGMTKAMKKARKKYGEY